MKNFSQRWIRGMKSTLDQRLRENAFDFVMSLQAVDVSAGKADQMEG